MKIISNHTVRPLTMRLYEKKKPKKNPETSIYPGSQLPAFTVFFFFFFFFFFYIYQGPVVQSVVSLTSSLRVISLNVLADSIYNILIFFAEKM